MNRFYWASFIVAFETRCVEQTQVLIAEDAGVNIVKDAPADTPVDRPTLRVSCNELGSLADGRTVPRVGPSRGKVIVRNDRVFERSAGSRGGRSLLIVRNRLWWSEGVDGCLTRGWGTKTWSFSLEPDTPEDAVGRCEPRAPNGSFTPLIAWNNNVLGVCYGMHPYQAVSGGPFLDQGFQCGTISPGGSPGQMTPTFRSETGSYIEFGTRGGANGFAVLSDGDVGGPMLQFLNGDAEGDGAPLEIAPRSFWRGKVAPVGDETWAVVLQRLPSTHLPVTVVRTHHVPAPAITGTIEIPDLRGEDWITTHVHALPTAGGLAMVLASHSRNQPESSISDYMTAVDLALACTERSVRVPLLRGQGYVGEQGAILMRDGLNWALLVQRKLPGSSENRLELWRVDADGTVRGDATEIARESGLLLRAATPGLSANSLWVIYSTGVENIGALIDQHLVEVVLQ